ncbi:MAG: cyclopropane-fatty-acyl-phospholipid synthase family protein [Xanthobacteraceae bacterium]|nr:cyclopropane-fatty-acyl-phospholipid synthase family protein [Xanthobacteraceae bacterium]
MTTRLDAFRRLLAHVRERLGFGPGFVLWDGSTVPDSLPANALAIRIADEGAIAALMRRPNLPTICNLWVAGRLDILNGTIFDMVAARPKTRSRDTRKALDKGLLFNTMRRFLFLPRGGPWPLEKIGTQEKPADGDAARNQENIQYHYDLSNNFYSLFLDPEMVYSCAYFTDPGNDIATAQRDKLEMICRKLRLKEGERFLDVGCGWGALVCHAAQHHGVKARGVTLSQQQFDFAQAKIARLGLADRVTVEMKDFSALDGVFDKIASIGMFEHVGIVNYPAYFQTINRLLSPSGLYLHHSIARPAKRTERQFRRSGAASQAIQKYIFPGGELDHLGMSIANLQRYGFEVHDVEGWREHYARTCRHWHDRLQANRAAAESEVGIEKTRLWLLYLAGCSIGFERGMIGIFQTLTSKRQRGSSGVPLTRADLYR